MTMRATLNVLADVAPEWLHGFTPPEWYERYGARIEDTRLPQGKAARAGYGRLIGVEGTISQGVRAFGLRQTRSRGLQETHLQHVITAAAINLARLGAWREGQPHAKSRTSRFGQLAA